MMLKFILGAYQNTFNLLVKKPQVLLLLAFVVLISIPLSTTRDRFEQNSLNNNLLWLLSLLIAWTLDVFLFWVVFRSDGATTLSFSEWFRNKYPRILIQYVGGFLLFFPVYVGLRLIFGEEGLALQPGHAILMISLSVWMFIVMYLGALWLCFRNDGFLQNIKNAIQDVFRNFGYYLILRLIALVFAYLSLFARSDPATFTAFACGLWILISILMDVSWMAMVFGFLGLRKRGQMNLMSGDVDVEKNHAS